MEQYIPFSPCWVWSDTDKPMVKRWSTKKQQMIRLQTSCIISPFVVFIGTTGIYCVIICDKADVGEPRLWVVLETNYGNSNQSLRGDVYQVVAALEHMRSHQNGLIGGKSAPSCFQCQLNTFFVLAMEYLLHLSTFVFVWSPSLMIWVQYIIPPAIAHWPVPFCSSRLPVLCPRSSL